MTTWTISIDWDRNGDFVDTYDNVTSYVTHANWFLGFRRPYLDVADGSVLALTLDNSDRRFSPEYSAGPLYGKLLPFRAVRVQSNDGTTTRTHWVGWLEKIEPEVNVNGKRTVQITAMGAMKFLEAAETHIELQENLRANDILAALLEEVDMPPILGGSWILSKYGSTELGTTTWLTEPQNTFVLETGISTFAFAGDNWVYRGGPNDSTRNSFDVYRAIRDIVAAERGRFYFDRDGIGVFVNRHSLLRERDISATFDDSMTGLQYAFAGTEDLKNEIYVTCHPRSVSASSGETLWTLESPITIPAGQTYRVVASYRDESANRIGGRAVTLEDVTFSVGATGIVNFTEGANSAEIELINEGEDSATMNTAVIRGQKITDFGQMEASAIDEESVGFFGRRTMRMNLAALDNLEHAQGIAQFELQRRKTPRGTVSSITLTSHGTEGSQPGNPQHDIHQYQLGLVVGHRIVVKEAQTYHGNGDAPNSTASYYIIGEAHKLSNGGELYETTWYLEPTPVEPYPWVLDSETNSCLGISTYLTY